MLFVPVDGITGDVGTFETGYFGDQAGHDLSACGNSGGRRNLRVRENGICPFVRVQSEGYSDGQVNHDDILA